ncbi:MAG: hypothetical protein ACM3L8_01935 [Verrucomicrobiota bacterium]
MGREPLRQWLLLIDRLPPEPRRFRTYAWRQEKMLGCLHRQQKVRGRDFFAAAGLLRADRHPLARLTPCNR